MGFPISHGFSNGFSQGFSHSHGSVASAAVSWLQQSALRRGQRHGLLRGDGAGSGLRLWGWRSSVEADGKYMLIMGFRWFVMVTNSFNGFNGY